MIVIIITMIKIIVMTRIVITIIITIRVFNKGIKTRKIMVEINVLQ